MASAEPGLAGVVFDLDDTLSDYALVEERVWAATVESVASVLPGFAAPEARRRFTACREPLYERILSGEWSVEEYRRGQLAATVAPWGVLPEHVLAEHCALRESVVDETSPMEGTHALLDALRERGLRVGILTNGSADLLHRKLAALGIAERIDAARSAVALGTPKPQPAAYAAAATALDLPPGRLAMVGDHLEWDVAAPLRSGYAAALWLDRGTGVHDPAALPAGAGTITRLDEVLGALGLGLSGPEGDG